MAEAAVARAEATDVLVDHGDACLSLAMVLRAACDAAGARAAAEQAVVLYERKGAAALAEMARRVVGEPRPISAPAEKEPPSTEPVNACVRVGERAVAAIDRGAHFLSQTSARLLPEDLASHRSVELTSPAGVSILGFSPRD